MKRIYLLVGIAVLLSLFFIACQPSDDDDDNDAPEEDLHGNGWPEEGLPACPPYHEYEPWFTINDFDNAANTFEETYGEQFVLGTVNFVEEHIVVVFDEMELVIDWLGEGLQNPFEDGQIVQAYLGAEFCNYDRIPRYLWIMDENDDLLLYHDQYWLASTRQIGNHTNYLEDEFTCEYYDNRPPTPEGLEWSLVFSQSVKVTLDSMEYFIDQVGTETFLYDDTYAIFMPASYNGQFSGTQGTSYSGCEHNDHKTILQIVRIEQ